MKNLAKSSYLFIFLLIFFSCSNDDDASENISENIDECVTYDPEQDESIMQDAWTDSDQVTELPGFLPASTDPAGGYYIVTVSTSGSSPWIEISQPNQGVIVNGYNENGTSETSRTVAIAAHYGESYDVKVSPSWYPMDDLSPDNPDDFSVKWEYQGFMDCYEPNNSFEQAKQIPLNKTIEALANINNKRNMDGALDDYEDYYKIVLHEPTQLKFDLLESPADMFLEMKLYDANKDQLNLAEEVTYKTGDYSTEGSLYYKVTKVLQPGIYYVDIYSWDTTFKSHVDFDSGGQIPDSWNTPYKFKVTDVN